MKVQKPSYANAHLFVGVVAPQQTGGVTNGGMVKVVPPDYIVPGVPVRTDQSITQDDLLGVHIGTYYLRKGCCGGPIVGRAAETQDRSSTAGLVYSYYGSIQIGSSERARYVRETNMTFADFPAVAAAAVQASNLTCIVGTGCSIAQPANDATLIGPILTLDGTDNDAVGLQGNRQYICTLNKPIIFECELQFGSSLANISAFLGLNDEVLAAAGIISDADALVTASLSHLGFFFAAAGTTVTLSGDNEGTQTTATAIGTVAASTTLRLGFVFDGIAGATNTKGTVTPYVNGVAQTSKTIGATPGGIPDAKLMAPTVVIKSNGTAGASMVLSKLRVQQPV